MAKAAFVFILYRQREREIFFENKER